MKELLLTRGFVESKTYREIKMNSKHIKTLKRHISTHTARSAEDRSAVSYLENVLNITSRNLNE